MLLWQRSLVQNPRLSQSSVVCISGFSIFFRRTRKRCSFSRLITLLSGYIVTRSKRLALTLKVRRLSYGDVLVVLPTCTQRLDYSVKRKTFPCESLFYKLLNHSNVCIVEEYVVQFITITYMGSYSVWLSVYPNFLLAFFTWDDSPSVYRVCGGLMKLLESVAVTDFFAFLFIRCKTLHNSPPPPFEPRLSSIKIC